jgi:hypothetical protein
MRQTSIDVYHQIEAEGLLSRLRWEVYKVIFHNGPLTCRELGVILYGGKNKYMSSVSPRFAELLEAGVIEDRGTRKCEVTGRTSIIWDVTDKLPKKSVKPEKIKCKLCNGRGYLIQERLF